MKNIVPPVLLGAAAYFGFFMFTLWAISWIAGWKKIARHFAARSQPVGTTFRWQSLRTLWIGGYNHCLNVTFCDEGIHMVPSFAFRFAHPAVLIPWGKVGPLTQQHFIVTRHYLPFEVEGKTFELSLTRPAREHLAARGR